MARKLPIPDFRKVWRFDVSGGKNASVRSLHDSIVKQGVFPGQHGTLFRTVAQQLEGLHGISRTVLHPDNVRMLCEPEHMSTPEQNQTTAPA
jgi:hypothetical protein